MTLMAHSADAPQQCRRYRYVHMYHKLKSMNCVIKASDNWSFSFKYIVRKQKEMQVDSPENLH